VAAEASAESFHAPRIDPPLLSLKSWGSSFSSNAELHGPAHTLDQLAGEVSRLEVGTGDPLAVDHGVGGLGLRIGDYEYLMQFARGTVRLGESPASDDAAPAPPS
jgi:hypothetical protein